jgi:hypothetical protein
MSKGEYRCEKCGEKLDPDTMVWLELSHKTGMYTRPDLDGDLPEDESQGGFTFGRACAKTVLKNGGNMTRLQRRRSRGLQW